MNDSKCIRSEPWHVLCKVIKQEGECAAGHKVGDEVLFTVNGIKGNLCISALYSVLPKVFAMMFNANFPWLDDQCKAIHACPDPYNPVVLELSRVEPEQ